jgi:hypothetical protein
MIDAPSIVDFPDEREREERTYVGDWTTLPHGVFFDMAFGASDVRSSESLLVTFTGTGEVAPSGFVAQFGHQKLHEDDGLSVEVSGLTGLVAYHRGRFRAEEVRKAEDF